ncbi:MAG: DUF2213 domain-containing protein [Symploca sp. SIO2C1]|nr:DUF2213 domain-containing protein [Symploca sp. SIO2C1]
MAEPQLFRLDKFDPLPWEKLSDGRYWTHVVLGKVDRPLKYYSLDENGKFIERTEVVTSEGLFNDDSVRTIAGLPMVLVHPRKGKFNLNREGLRVGTLLNRFAREDDKLLAEAIVDDYRGVAVIERILAAGKLPEASSGYGLKKLTQREDGIWEQFRGDYDHVAAPLEPGGGRAGEGVGLRFDQTELREGFAIAEDAAELLAKPLYFDLGSQSQDGGREDSEDRRDEQIENTGDKKKVATIVLRLDNTDRAFEVTDEGLISAIGALQSRADSLQSDLEKVEGELEKSRSDYSRLEGELEVTKSQLEKADSNRMDENAIAAQIQQRLDVWSVAVPDLRQDNPNFQPDYRLSSTKAKAFCLGKLTSIKLDGRDASFIDGAWDTYLQMRGSRSREDESLADDLFQQAGGDSERRDMRKGIEDAREERRRRIENRGRTPRQNHN